MKLWRTAAADESVAQRLAGDLGLSAPMGRLLAARRWTDPAEAGRFLAPRLADLADPFDLPGMEAAVERVWRAVDGGETIVVYGDYDVDGITATALLSSALESLGAKVRAFLPNRMDDGYGLTADTLDRCVAEHRPGLVITVDCGTNSTAAAARAAELGVDLVVTDHHQPAGPLAEPAVAVLNPRLGDPGAAWRDLAGVGVAFKLAFALVKRGRERGRPAASGLDLRPMLDRVALGTVADCVDLRGENRILVRHGLPYLKDTPSAGLRALMEVAGVREELDTFHVGFLLGPRLNAAGRLGTAEAALELLRTSDRGRARTLARGLDDANRERQAIEKGILDAAVEQVKAWFDESRDFALVAADRAWHPGVIGIVAARLAQRYGRPAAVIALDGEGGGRGSCRSIEGFDLVECLRDCAGVLRRCGGHAMAAGLELDEPRLAEFRRQFNDSAARRLRGSDLRPVLRVDAWVSLEEAGDGLVGETARLRPCGQGNPEPVWAVRGVRLRDVRRAGANHAKLIVESGRLRREAVAFNMTGEGWPAGEADVAFELRYNTWNGRTTLQLRVRDVRPSEAA